MADMRFVPIQSVRKGTIIKETIYSENGIILLKQGTPLKDAYIRHLMDMGVNGLYIDDEISKEIEITTTISGKLKNEAVQKMKNAFTFAKKEKFTTSEMLQASEAMYALIENVIDEILSNDNFMINMVDLKVFDDYTFFHSVSVATISIMIAVNMDFKKNELIELGLSAILHDIGKVFTPKDILNKKGCLTDDEMVIMKGHSDDGYRYLKEKFNVPMRTYIGVLQHHEKWDGSGYPLGITGTNISKYARIIAVADVYDALTSDRPYRKGMFPSEAMEYIMGGGGTFFDPEIVQVFYKSMAIYPNGTIVELSNGLTGIVVQNIPGRTMRPILKILKDKDEDVCPYVYDMGDSKTMSTTIIKIANM